MFVVFTGLDGTGTSTIARAVHEMDCGSTLLKTPSEYEYSNRAIVDSKVRKESCIAHYLYYLSSSVYMSDYIKNNLDYKNHNVYCVRYLIDTVVSNRVAGLDVILDYEILGHKLLKPDLTIYLAVDEDVREKRITHRGKSELDKVLDNQITRGRFLEEFKNILEPNNTIYINNTRSSITDIARSIYDKIKGEEYYAKEFGN